MSRLTRMTALAAGVVLLSSCSSLSSEPEPSGGGEAAVEFPGSEPVTILMPYTAGGSSDFIARTVAGGAAEPGGSVASQGFSHSTLRRRSCDHVRASATWIGRKPIRSALSSTGHPRVSGHRRAAGRRRGPAPAAQPPTRP